MVDEYQNKGFNKILNKARAEKILIHARGDTCLEVGAGEGQITKYLVNKFKKVVSIDINQDCLDQIEDANNLYKICNKFEDIEVDEVYDTIICSNVLEHVDNPKAFLERMTKWGNEETVFIFVVPNGRSYNRLLGMDIGLIEDPLELTEQDISAGHKRMYGIHHFESDLILSDFEILESGSYIYKPLPNALMDKMNHQLIKKCLSMKMTINGAELYAVCKLR